MTPRQRALQSNDGDSSTILYVPNAGFTGVDTLTFRANDGIAQSNTATVTIQVAGPQPTPPDQIHLAWVENPATTLTVVWRTLDVTTPSSIEYRPVGATTWRARWERCGRRAPPARSAGRTRSLANHRLRVPRPRRGRGVEPDLHDAHGTRRRAADFTAVYVADLGLIGRLDGLATGTEQVVNEIAALQPTLVLPGGDYIYFDTDQRYGTFDNTIDAWFNQMQPIAAQAPLMPTYWNHEAVLGEGFEPWAARFQSPAGFDGRRYYSFDVGDVHFVSIFAVNSTEASRRRAPVDPAGHLGRQGLRSAMDHPLLPRRPSPTGSSHPSNLQLQAQLGPLFERAGSEARARFPTRRTSEPIRSAASRRPTPRPRPLWPATP